MKAITVATLTNTTCGEACWHARDEVCRCSCGGRNHGVLCSPDGERPVRTAKIDGYRYDLVAAGTYNELIGQASRELSALGYHGLNVVQDGSGRILQVYRYVWRENESGSPYRLRPASALQCEKWPELSQFSGLEIGEFRRLYPALLWRRVDIGDMRFTSQAEIDRLEAERTSQEVAV